MNFPKIKNMYFILTHQCNLKCKYCFVNQCQETMSYDTACKGIDFLIKDLPENKRAVVNFFGGEPLLHWNDVIKPSVLYGESKYPNRVKFNITTNCVLLDDEKSDFIIKHDIGILTSFDGCKETQDYNRPFHNGSGSYDIVYNNIMTFKKYSGKLETMRATVHPHTAHLMYENYLQAIDMGYSKIFFVPDSFSDFTEDEKNKYKEALYKIAEHYISYWNENNSGPIIIGNMERHFPQAIEDIWRDDVGLAFKMKCCGYRCGLGNSIHAALGPNGDIYACQQMTSDSKKDLFWLGDLDVGVLDERRLAMLDTFDSELRTGDMSCKKCSARSICDGGCVASNYSRYSELRHCSPTYCMNMRLLHDVEMYIARKLKNNTGFQTYVQELSKKNKTICSICQEEQQKF